MFSVTDSIQVIDTIEFLDESFSLSYNANVGRLDFLYKWRIKDYLGYKLLIIDNHHFPNFFIDTDDNKNFRLRRNPSELMAYSLNDIEVQNDLNREKLMGEWRGNSNRPDKPVSFTFIKDSVIMNDLARNSFISDRLQLNLNNEKMFLFNSYILDIVFYKIDLISNDSLSINRLYPIKDSFILTRKKKR